MKPKWKMTLSYNTKIELSKKQNWGNLINDFMSKWMSQQDMIFHYIMFSFLGLNRYLIEPTELFMFSKKYQYELIVRK